MKVILIKPLPDKEENDRFNKKYLVGTLFNAEPSLGTRLWVHLVDVTWVYGSGFPIMKQEKSCFRVVK